ncbi:C39 family peptidase [Lactococcus sp.]|uniref:C39 family peptidase n=1 Tax=Lactococcus sp. TaxID=44273 RepID=UPI0035B2E97B
MDMRKIGIKSSVLLAIACLAVSEVTPLLSTSVYAETNTQTTEQLSEQSSEQSTGQTTEQSTEESTEQSTEASTSESSTEHSTEENTSEPSTEQSTDETTTEQAPIEKTSAVEKTPKVQYSTYIQNKKWLPQVENGALSGTSGQKLRMESLKIALADVAEEETGGISYSTHIQDKGWTSESSNGNASGTIGQSKRLEAVKIRLTGDIAKQYSVYYRVHVQNVGWTNFVKDNEIAGTSGLAWRLEAIEIRLVKKGEQAPISSNGVKFGYLTLPKVNYQTHVQNIGWQNTVTNGANSGTTGRSLRLEGIKLSLENVANQVSGSITYRTHVQNIGWQNYVSNGAVSGTTGKKLRLEAIEIKLTGDLAKYFDVQYQTHVQGFGWLGWAVNGQQSGTSKVAYRMETIKIKVVPKGTAKPTVGAFAFVNQKTGWRSVNGRLKYINAKNNSVIKQFAMPYYSQRDSRWSNKRYAGYTLGNTGCGMASMAMIISGFGTSVTPVQTADYAHAYGTFDRYPEVGSAQSDLTMVANRWGLDYKVMRSANELATYLSQGYPATVCLDLGNGVRHIVVLRGYSSGYTTATDPWNGLIFSGRHTVAQVWSLLSWKADNINKGSSAATVFLPR